MNVISVRGVHKTFAKRSILRGVDCDVLAGESFGLVGANGAGKTTLLRAILDYIAIDQGSIEIFGVSSRVPASRARLAFLPERFVPPSYLRGNDFVNYVLRLHRIERDEQQIRRVFDIVQLDASAMTQSVRVFSKGMAQKLGLAVTFLSNRDLLILDEPLSGLDPAARASVRAHFARLRDAGKTLFFTTHMLTDVEALCDRIGILDEGALGFLGTPARCREQFAADTLEAAYLSCTSGMHRAVEEA